MAEFVRVCYAPWMHCLTSIAIRRNVSYRRSLLVHAGSHSLIW